MKTDWGKIKRSYVEGPETTYPILAEKFQVNHDSLKRHAAKENWAEDRKLFQNKVQNLRAEKRSEIMASESAEFDKQCLIAARKGVEIVNTGLAKKKKSIPGLALALTNFQKAGRLAMGEPETPGKGEDIDAKDKLISAINRIAARCGADKDTADSKPG